jgi:DNA-binding transcriptional MerR regulator
MRIGEAASRTGLSARTIRYYEQRGVIRGARTRDGHRRYTDDEVRRLRRMRALLAANIAPEWAERALDADLPDAERREVLRALELLIAEAQEMHGGSSSPAPVWRSCRPPYRTRGPARSGSTPP